MTLERFLRLVPLGVVMFLTYLLIEIKFIVIGMSYGVLTLFTHNGYMELQPGDELPFQILALFLILPFTGFYFVLFYIVKRLSKGSVFDGSLLKASLLAAVLSCLYISFRAIAPQTGLVNEISSQGSGMDRVFYIMAGGPLASFFFMFTFIQMVILPRIFIFITISALVSIVLASILVRRKAEPGTEKGD